MMISQFHTNKPVTSHQKKKIHILHLQIRPVLIIILLPHGNIPYSIIKKTEIFLMYEKNQNVKSTSNSWIMDETTST